MRYANEVYLSVVCVFFVGVFVVSCVVVGGDVCCFVFECSVGEVYVVGVAEL